MNTNLSRGLRNNNPGNIRISPEKFKGEVQPSQDKAFKQFETPAHGYRAMFKILLNYRKKYHLINIRDWISRWAPETENNTDIYVRAVAYATGIWPDTEIDVTDKELMCRIVAAMSRVENGCDANMTDIKAGWELL